MLAASLVAGCVGGTVAAESSLPRTPTVTETIDGDTIEVRFADGTTGTVRLLGVDTPETYGDMNPSEFPGVSNATPHRCSNRREGVPHNWILF